MDDAQSSDASAREASARDTDRSRAQERDRQIETTDRKANTERLSKTLLVAFVSGVGQILQGLSPLTSCRSGCPLRLLNSVLHRPTPSLKCLHL